MYTQACYAITDWIHSDKLMYSNITTNTNSNSNYDTKTTTTITQAHHLQSTTINTNTNTTITNPTNTSAAVAAATNTTTTTTLWKRRCSVSGVDQRRNSPLSPCRRCSTITYSRP